MFDAKFKVDFQYKTLSYNDVEKIFNVIKTDDSINIYKIKCSREIKENSVVRFEENEFNSFDDLLEYLKDNINYLDKICFMFMNKKNNEIWLKYDDIYNRWELTYNKKSIEIDGLILNIKSIFRRNIIDIYKQNKYIIFWIVLAIQVTVCVIFQATGIISYILNVLLIITMLLNVFLKYKPYQSHKFIEKNKDEIILSVIFYILGVATPYAINFIKLLFR